MSQFFRIGRKYFLFTAVLSFFINILSLAVPLFIMLIYDRVLFSYSMPSLATLSTGAIFSIIVMGCLLFIRSRLLLQSAFKFDQEFSAPVWHRLCGQAKFPGGDARSDILDDLSTFRRFITHGAMQALFDVLWVPVYLVVLFFLHPLLAYSTLGLLLFVAFLAFIYNRLVRNRLLIADMAGSKAQRFNDALLNNADLVYTEGIQAPVFAAWQKLKRREIDLEYKAGKQAGIFRAFFTSIRFAAQVGIYALGAYMFFGDHISAGGMFAAVLIVTLALGPAEYFIYSLGEMIRAKGSYKRLKSYLDAAEPDAAMQLPAPEGKLTVEAGLLVLDQKNVLRNIGLDLEKGENLAVIGPSAAGKTVLCKLLLGIWPPSAGKVRLDGADMQQWDRGELGRYVGYLPQETELFPGTVSENIARMQDVDPDKVVKAAQNAGIHQMILQLPQGYDTPIKNRGANFSFAWKRHIALAGAFYNDPVFVVLDEPEMGMDDMGERVLKACLARLKQAGVTTVFTTHRPGLIAHSDKILYLKHGQVAMFGPKQDVLAKLSEQQKQQGGGA